MFRGLSNFCRFIEKNIKNFGGQGLQRLEKRGKGIALIFLKLDCERLIMCSNSFTAKLVARSNIF